MSTYVDVRDFPTLNSYAVLADGDLYSNTSTTTINNGYYGTSNSADLQGTFTSNVTNPNNTNAPAAKSQLSSTTVSSLTTAIDAQRTYLDNQTSFSGATTNFSPNVNYKAAAAVTLNAATTFDAGGDLDAQFFILIQNASLTFGGGFSMVLSGGAQAKNIFFLSHNASGSSAVSDIIISATSPMYGIFINYPNQGTGSASITVNTAVNITGRLYSADNAVKFDFVSTTLGATVDANIYSTDIENNLAYATLNTFAVLCTNNFTGNAAINGNLITISDGLYGSGSDVYNNENTVLGNKGTNTNIATALTQLTTFAGAVAAAAPSAPSAQETVTGTNQSFLPGFNYINSGQGLTFSQTLTFTGTATDQFFITFTGGHSMSFSGVTTVVLTTASGTVNPKNIFWRNTQSSASGLIQFHTTTNSANIPGIFMYLGSSGDSDNGIQVKVPSAIVGRFYTATGPIIFTQSDYSGSLGSSVDGNFDGVLCYAKGTLILTKKGFVPIETIKEGDKLVTKGKIYKNKFIKEEAAFKTSSVMWISKFKPRRLNSKSLPICIEKDALGENYPFADLYVSPGHRLLLDGKMVLSTDLINNKTIYQDKEYDGVEYYHLECDHHRAIVANGVLSETFLELDNSKRVFNKPNAVRAKK